MGSMDDPACCVLPAMPTAFMALPSCGLQEANIVAAQGNLMEVVTAWRLDENARAAANRPRPVAIQAAAPAGAGTSTSCV